MEQTQKPVKFSCSFHVKEFGHQFDDDSDPYLGKLAYPYLAICNLQQKLYPAFKTKFAFL